MARSLSSTLPTLALPIVLILVTSFSFITCVFLSLLTHVSQTRPYQSFTTTFYATTTSTLETNVSLQDAPLRSASFLEAYLHITLPESATNLNHPVFTISTTLHTSDQLCVAHRRTNAALRFRSSTMQSLRAIAFYIPITMGVMSEYQSVNIAILHYTPTNHSERLHRMTIVLSAPLHISSATVNVSVKRRSFLGVLGSYVPWIMLGTIALSMTLLACAFGCVALAWAMYTLVRSTVAMAAQMHSGQRAQAHENIARSEVSMSSISSQTSVTTDTTRESYNTLRKGTTALSLQRRPPTRMHDLSGVQ